MTLDEHLRQLVREAAQLAIRDELPRILGETLKRVVDAHQTTGTPVKGTDPALSTEQAAEYAGVTPATIRAKVAIGELRAIRPGRTIKIRRSDLDAFLARSAPREGGVIDLSARAREILSSTRRSND